MRRSSGWAGLHSLALAWAAAAAAGLLRADGEQNRGRPRSRRLVSRVRACRWAHTRQRKAGGALGSQAFGHTGKSTRRATLRFRRCALHLFLAGLRPPPLFCPALSPPPASCRHDAPHSDDPHAGRRPGPPAARRPRRRCVRRGPGLFQRTGRCARGGQGAGRAVQGRARRGARGRRARLV